MMRKIREFKAKLGKWFWLIAIALIIVLLKLTVFRDKPLDVKVENVQKGNITEIVSVTGQIRADNYANLTFQGGGRLAWVNVKEGQKVRKGQGLAGLDTVILNSSYQQALNNYRNYQAQATSTLDSLKDNDSDETFSQKATRTAAEVARDNAYDTVKAAEQNLRYATIFSPFNGVMAKVEPSFPGSNVTSQTASFVVIDPDTTYFYGELSESDLPRVKLGQKVNIKIDAYPEEVFEGVLENIGILAFTSSTGGNAYSVRISMPKNIDLKFRVGMDGDADIVMSTIENVLTVDFASVVNIDGQDYVWVVENDKAKKKTVEVGISSINEVEIKSGLSEGEKIIIDPSTKLIEGQKVR